jgi:hypothetical protein
MEHIKPTLIDRKNISLIINELVNSFHIARKASIMQGCPLLNIGPAINPIKHSTLINFLFCKINKTFHLAFKTPNDC